MAAVTGTQTTLPWWQEPTGDQWLAWVAAWLGWTLDAYSISPIFLLIMKPIADFFGVPLIDVAWVFTIWTLWMRLIGATVGSGWLARIGWAANCR